MIDFDKIVATSAADGFKNYKKVDFSATVPGQTLSPGTAVVYTAAATLDNANAISQIQIKYNGLDNFWRVANGLVIGNYPSFAAIQYQVGSYGYYQNGQVLVSTYIADQIGGATIPPFTVQCRASLFLAPF